MRAARRSFSFSKASVFLLVLFGVTPVLQGQGLDAGARALAQKIVAEPGTVMLTVHNLSSLGPAQFAAARRALEGELHHRGAKVVATAPADAEVRVTLAENVQGYLWIAEIRRGDKQRVAMELVDRSTGSVPVSASPVLVLKKQFVWEQPALILDFALPSVAPDGMPRMLVLEPERLAFYRFDQARWQLQESLPIPHEKHWPRDLRGRLSVGVETLEADLPGVTCEGLARRELAVECRVDESQVWPLDAGGEERGDAPSESTRNYFPGLLVIYGEKKETLPPFFSAAVLKLRDQTHYILAGLDGQARLYEESSEPVAKYSGWGSDIVSLGTGCDAPWQILVTGAGDWTRADAVQAYQIIDREAMAAGAPVEFPGPVKALWPAPDGKSANVVSQNLKTGQYEAYTLSISRSH